MTAIMLRADFKRWEAIWRTRLLRGVKLSVGRCENCGSTKNLTVHHVEQLSKNGNDFTDNIVVLCRECHEGFHWLEIKRP